MLGQEMYCDHIFFFSWSCDFNFFFISLVLPKPVINLLYVFQHLYFVPISKYPTCLKAFVVFSPL